MIPEKIISGIRAVTGSTEEDIINGFSKPSPVSVRFNPYKISEPPQLERVPWSTYGFYLPERPVFTLDPLYHSGIYYVQEPSSMFLETIYDQLFEDKEGLKILDLSAAPGGKSTLLSTKAGATSTVIANEVIRSRANILAENIRRWGLGNVIVTNNDPSHFKAAVNYFDMILVDAPCSGEGMIRKNPSIADSWSENNVKLCSQRQRRIIADVWDSIKPGGYLVYSTCTFNKEENEHILEWLSGTWECEGVPVITPVGSGIVETQTSDGMPVYRFFHHLIDGEGFTVAVIRKTGGHGKEKITAHRRTQVNAVPRKELDMLSRLVNQPEHMNLRSVGDRIHAYYQHGVSIISPVSATLNILYSGIVLGQIFNGKFKPDHSLALFHDLNRDYFPTVDCGLEEALEYLRRGSLDTHEAPEGYNLVTYDGHPLGFANRIGNRFNNMLPKQSRIMNL